MNKFKVLRVFDVELEMTKTGKPAFWEEGGGMSNTGNAYIVAKEDGGKPTATYIKRKGQRANSEHALFILRKGMYIIYAYHHRKDFSISVRKVAEIFKKDEKWYAKVEEIFEYSDNEWVPSEPPEFLKSAIKAAIEKAQCYHCRTPHYAVEKKKPIV